MILYNFTRKTTITRNLKEAKSAIDKLLGLHIKTNPRALLFKTRFGIHTFFLKCPVDVIVLNAKNLVIITRTLKPNRVLIYNPRYPTVIELPQGTIKKSRIFPKDQLIIK